MKNNLVSWVVGFIFALGLGISGMTQPQKIVGFLNVFGAWDPSLIFVMAGSIVIHFISYRLIKPHSNPWFSSAWHVPTKKDITASLCVGSLLFGIGWGLGGYCPGPAIVSVASLQYRPIMFIAAMAFGMLLFKVMDKAKGFHR